MLLASSVALAFMPPVAGIPLAAYIAVGLLLLGGMAALPWLLGAVLGLVPASLSRQPLSMLALERARRMRRSTTVAVGGMVASLSLAVALTVMVTSFRGSMMEWLDAVLPAPMYVRAAGGSSRADAALLPADAAQRLSSLPGIARAQAMRSSTLLLSPERPAISILVRPSRVKTPSNCPGCKARSMPAAAASPFTLASPWPNSTSCSPAMTGLCFPRLSASKRRLIKRRQLPLYSWHLARLCTPIWRDCAGLAGLSEPGRRCPGQRDRHLAREPASTAHAAGHGTRADQRRPGPASAGAGQQPARERSLRIFDRSFAVTYWLQAVAIGIGLFGIAASFSARWRGARSSACWPIWA